MRTWLIQKLGAVRVEIYMKERQVSDYYRGLLAKETMQHSELIDFLDDVVDGKRVMYKGVRIKAVPECKRKRDAKGRFADEA